MLPLSFTTMSIEWSGYPALGMFYYVKHTAQICIFCQRLIEDMILILVA